MNPTPPLRPHEELLLSLCDRDAPDDLSSERLGDLADPALRARLVEAADRHDVLGLVLSTVERTATVDELPPEMRREFLAPLQLLSRQALLWDMERERLVRLFDGSGLDPLWLKGGALRGTVYSRSVQRPLGDFDLLVEPDRLEATLRVLKGAGYESRLTEDESEAVARHHFHHRLTHRAGFVVEVHWDLTKPSDPYRLDAATFWRRSRPWTTSTRLRIRAPSPEDMLLHCAAQNYEDAFSRLRRVVDLDRIIRDAGELEWDTLIRSAHRAGLSGCLAFSLQLSRWTLGTRLPAHLLAELELSRGLRVHTSMLFPVRSHLRQSFRERPASAWLLTFWLSPSGSVRRELLFRRLTGTDEPLEWLWRDEEDPDDAAAGSLAGVWKVVKLAVYQLGIYVRSLAKLATAAGRRELRFWTSPPE